MAFHEVRYPLCLSYGSRGGPERRTEVVTLGSGDEERNSLWQHSRRRYNAGPGLRDAADIETLLAFFEERRGRFHGFRWRDTFDHRSCTAAAAPTALDEAIGTGDGATATFQLVKTYGGAFAPYQRPIRKPVAGTVLVAVAGTAKTLGTHFTVNTTTGIVTFLAGSIPTVGQAVTAGFEFDVPVRFDTDSIEIDFAAFKAGQVPDIPVIELRR